MGTYELLLVLIIAKVYLAIPVITLIVVIRSNKRITQIEPDLKQVLKSKKLSDDFHHYSNSLI